MDVLDGDLVSLPGGVYLDALARLVLLAEHVDTRAVRVHNLVPLLEVRQVVGPDAHKQPLTMVQLVLPVDVKHIPAAVTICCDIT